MVLASQGLYFLMGFNPKALSPTFSPNNTNTKGGLNYKQPGASWLENCLQSEKRIEPTQSFAEDVQPSQSQRSLPEEDVGDGS